MPRPLGASDLGVTSVTSCEISGHIWDTSAIGNRRRNEKTPAVAGASL